MSPSVICVLLKHPDALIQVPVILVGNKIDVRGGEVTNEALEQEIIPIMNEFKVRFICSRRGHPTRQHIVHMNVDGRAKLSWSGEAFAVVGR